MNSSSLLFFRFYIAVICLLICFHSYKAMESTENNLDQKVKLRKPRFIRVYSNPPGEESDKPTRRQFHEHVNNALRGGTVGVEFKMKPWMEKFHRWFNKIGEYFSGNKGYKKRQESDSKTPMDTNDVESREGFDAFDLDPRQKVPSALNTGRLEREFEMI